MRQSDKCVLMCLDRWGLFNIAHIFTGDKIGVEKFEFKNNETPKDFEGKVKDGYISLYLQNQDI